MATAQNILSNDPNIMMQLQCYPLIDMGEPSHLNNNETQGSKTTDLIRFKMTVKISYD